MARPRGRGRGRLLTAPPTTEVQLGGDLDNSGEHTRTPLAINDLISSAFRSQSRTRTLKSVTNTHREEGEDLCNDIQSDFSPPNDLSVEPCQEHGINAAPLINSGNVAVNVGLLGLDNNVSLYEKDGLVVNGQAGSVRSEIETPAHSEFNVTGENGGHGQNENDGINVGGSLDFGKVGVVPSGSNVTGGNGITGQFGPKENNADGLNSRTDNGLKNTKQSWNKIAKPKPGMSLHYCQHSADSTEIDVLEEDIEGELKFWENTLMCNVLGARPSVAQVQAYVTKAWNHVSPPAVLYYRKGWFSLRFSNKSDLDEVLRGGPWTMGNNSIILKQWTPTFSQEMDKISTVPIWILFPDLDPVLWSDKVLSKLASKVGKPLYADMTTTSKARLSFARVLVEADIATDLPDHVIINTPYHGQITQQITYEWKPFFCQRCKKMGHTDTHCRLNKKAPHPKPTWIPKEPSKPQNPEIAPPKEPQMTTNVAAPSEDMFSTPTKSCGQPHSPTNNDPKTTTPTQNRFSLLEGDDLADSFINDDTLGLVEVHDPTPPDKNADSVLEH